MLAPSVFQPSFSELVRAIALILSIYNVLIHVYKVMMEMIPEVELISHVIVSPPEVSETYILEDKTLSRQYLKYQAKWSQGEVTGSMPAVWASTDHNRSLGLGGRVLGMALIVQS